MAPARSDATGPTRVQPALAATSPMACARVTSHRVQAERRARMGAPASRITALTHAAWATSASRVSSASTEAASPRNARRWSATGQGSKTRAPLGVFACMVHAMSLVRQTPMQARTRGPTPAHRTNPSRCARRSSSGSRFTPCAVRHKILVESATRRVSSAVLRPLHSAWMDDASPTNRPGLGNASLQGCIARQEICPSRGLVRQSMM